MSVKQSAINSISSWNGWMLAKMSLPKNLFWGLVATGLLAGSLPAMMSPEPAPAAAIWGLVGSGIIAMIVTLRYFFAPALRKMRVRHWLERRWGSKDEDAE